MFGSRRDLVAGSAQPSADEKQARTAQTETDERAPTLLEEALRHENMMAALKRVVANEGAPGVDGLTVHDLEDRFATHWPRTRQELLEGRYFPQPVLRVDIPKSDGGTRSLGIPTVTDRLIQQAILQVLQPKFDPTFSDSSFGFRPKRSCHDAVKRAREHMKAGFTWVVDMDLEKFFDRVNHDILMDRLARRIDDKPLLRLIRRYLTAGMMWGGVVSPRAEGTPQGGPLSPLLSNVLLHELDVELERRGHRFARYADDCNVYVQSDVAGERVMASLERFLWERLRLKINRVKSAVAQPWDRKFLGYTVTRHGKKLKIAPASIKRVQAKLLPILQRNARGRSLEATCKELAPIVRGWVAYYRLAQVKAEFEALDKWVRRRLRDAIWRMWKRPRTRQNELLRRGIPLFNAAKTAYNGHGPWWNAGSWTMSQAFPAKALQAIGLVSFLEEYRRLQSS